MNSTIVLFCYITVNLKYNYYYKADYILPAPILMGIQKVIPFLVTLLPAISAGIDLFGMISSSG